MKLSTLRLPLSLSVINSLGTISGRERVLQGVAFFFMTRQGGRCMVPEFGVPPLPNYPEEVPAWNSEVESGLLLVGGVTAARVITNISLDNVLRGKAYIQTDGTEELEYDIELNSYA